MADANLAGYVQELLSNGKSKGEIIDALASQGWGKETIDTALAGAAANPVAAVRESSPRQSDKFIAWASYRRSFWTYFLLAACTYIFWPLFQYVPLVPLLLLLGRLVCAFAIAFITFVATRALRGKPSVLLTILAFFYGPIAFYLVYRMAKSRGVPATLNLLEGIFVAIAVVFGGILLIATIGLIISLGAIFFFLLPAAQPHFVSSPSVQTAHNIEIVRATLNADLKEADLQIALLSDKYSTGRAQVYEPASDCMSGFFADPAVAHYLQDAAQYASAPLTCGSSATQYAIQAQITGTSTGQNIYMCDGSNSGYFSVQGDEHRMQNGATVCP
jgi:hypothetical protein